MITRPSIPYSGLTIVLDKPSRFDEERLLSGPAGPWISEVTSLPIESIEIRTADVKEPFKQHTKYIALAGYESSKLYNSLGNDPPGYVFNIRTHNGPVLATTIFDPQDCCDFKNLSGNDEENEEATTDRDTKEHTPTRRKSYRFWTSWHLRKLLSPSITPEPKIEIHCYPSIEEICKILDTTYDQDIYLDIETSRAHQCLTCIGFSTTASYPKIYVVPVYLVSGELAYGNFKLFYKSLSLAIQRNKVVIHNAGFDLLVLAGFYGFPLPDVYGGSVYDTMLANHRICPEAEKSLAHVISMWTNQKYHKDFSTDIYDHEQQNKLWIYNAHDVYTLKLIKEAQLAYASRDTGLIDSIEQANKSIVPYLVTSLTGLYLDQMELSNIGAALAKEKEALIRIASTLVGRPFNPGSTQQCSRFFNDDLHYPIIARTETGKPAMGAKAMYQMMLKHNNPLLPVIIHYRAIAKDLGSLESELL